MIEILSHPERIKHGINVCKISATAFEERHGWTSGTLEFSLLNQLEMGHDGTLCLGQEKSVEGLDLDEIEMFEATRNVTDIRFKH